MVTQVSKGNENSFGRSHPSAASHIARESLKDLRAQHHPRG
jgi:hypothetical protein